MSETSGMADRHAYVIDPLLPDQLLCVPDSIQHFTRCDWSCRVLANESKPFLQLCRDRIFHPEKVVRFQFLAKPCCLNRCQPVMAIVQEMNVLPKLLPQLFKK